MFNKKMALIYILDILKDYSDINHPLTQQDIINKLKSIYDVEIERKTISSSISLLIDYGYDINKLERKGYYLGERELNENEIKYIIDSLLSSKSISSKDAIRLSNKLNSILSKYQRKDYSYIYKSKELNKLSTSDLFLNMEIINEAINENKQISFTYLFYNQDGKLIKRKDGYKYKVSPYYLINNYGKYYLLSNIEKYSTPSYFRIEHMMEIEILDNKRKEINKTSLGPNFNISNHINDHIYMFGSNIVTTKIEILDKWAITYIYDWFGKNAKIINQKDKKYAYIKSDETAFIYWFLQYQQYFTIIDPINVKEKIINIIKESLNRY